MEFKNLHNQDAPLLISNVWDAMSTQIVEKLGFQAIGTSSAAIANMLGYEDGEMMKFSELCYVVERIIANTYLPLTVDIESGYSREPYEIADNIKTLANLGVVGINIEDSVVTQKRTLLDAASFSETLSTIKQQLENDEVNIFINVRTDVFLLGRDNPVDETKKRIHLFEQAGADGVFVPCIENEDDIQAITKSSYLPLNVMCMPNLPDFKKLKELGVKRISMGNFLFDNMYNHFENTLSSVVKLQSFKSMF
ncbi:isocitrate lyase/PEP mutase family protein [Acidithiobacillus sulfurivorans]|uniref:Isocitrate lyase/phosphoenolpyruvate mutase family protein n=1 Tax=Acidithiobacillus sulfurivorans TaxID=1958756 RepID=A0ABS5ZYG9_9PROT|nr:isocitrate lyase/phosphoenolpyruvate mutase family protein [Acidithiobacillus sulfurivorans]MBU2760268.1 isocitrate lyase/phosphoenolpyruvate mutase family protein [Acidithiobacillus sulfurivorans]